MRELLFENPLPLYVVLALAEIVIAGLWYRGRTRRLAIALAIPPLLAGAVLALDLLVETPREKLQKAVRHIAADVERGDIRAACGYLSDDFGGHFVSRERAIEVGEKAWRDYYIRKVDVSDVEVKLPPDWEPASAVVHARSIVECQLPVLGTQKVALDWTVHWAYRTGEWKIIDIDEPKMAPGL